MIVTVCYSQTLQQTHLHFQQGAQKFLIPHNIQALVILVQYVTDTALHDRLLHNISVCVQVLAEHAKWIVSEYFFVFSPFFLFLALVSLLIS